MASTPRSRPARPALAGLQLWPPLTLLNTPLHVAAYRLAGVCGSTARAWTQKFRPLLAGLQLPPALVLLNTPPKNPTAYRVAGFSGSTARLWISAAVMPVLAALQLAP